MNTTQLTLTPRFSAPQAESILASLYGLRATLAPLPGERDQNFMVSADGDARYVLKIANAGEDPRLLDCQHAAMSHVRAALGDGACPRVVPTVDGDAMSAVECGDGKSHPVRLLSYLCGEILAKARPHAPELLTSVGTLLGRLDEALADFDHAAAHREFQWDLRRAEQVIDGNREWLPEGRRATVDRFLDGYRTRAKPRLGGLTKAVIHNDANDYNVIVGPNGRWGLRAAGLIDFGDMVSTWRVAEPAIAAAYVMLGKRDPLRAIAHVVAGYHHVLPFDTVELAVFFDLACMRLCASACIAARQTCENPDNEYLTISQGPIWDLLARLEDIPSALAHYTLRDACGLDPCPRSAALVARIRNPQASYSPVLRRAPDARALSIIDYSVGSAPAPAEHPQPDMPTQGYPGDESGSDIAIGRYDEARCIYSTPQFAEDSDGMPEQRTVHLGVDVMCAAGTPVNAPLAARIHSFADNSSPGDYGGTVILEHGGGEVGPFYTLYGHLSRSSLKNLTVGDKVPAGGLVGKVGEPHENGGWPPHLHFQVIADMLGKRGDFPGVAAPGSRRVWTSLCPDPGVLLGMDGLTAAPRERGPDELLAARRNRLGKALSLAYHRPLKIVRGAGQYLYDHLGRAYLDCVNNVCHVGHAHPRVVRAGQAQMAVLNTNTRYLHDGILDYAERLLNKFPDPLSVVYFTCSGSEANELALRMARACTGGRDVVVLDNAYHGNSQTLIDISPYKHNGRGGSGSPDWVHAAPMPDPYRAPLRGRAEDVAAIVEKLARAGGSGPTFIAESALGCGGQIILPDGYLASAYASVHAAGGICIADEVQVGFGRAGSDFWMFATQEVVPDIVTLGKPMGNGHPLAAVVTTREIADAFANGMEYFNTFGGNPVSCAIGRAVLDVIDDEDLQNRAATVGGDLRTGLHELVDRHALIGDVRGRGLFLGVELVTDRATLAPATEHAAQVVERLKDHGILASVDGPLENVLKFKPPMVLTRADADRVVETLDEILAEDRLRVD